MAGETPITIIGNLTRDPELRFTSSGVAVASFTVASTPRTYNRQSGQWEDGTALFVNCSAWRNIGENAVESLKKGARVIVTGRLVQRNYETSQGERRSSIEVQVDEVGPSLRYATAEVHRSERGGSGFGGQGTNQGGFNQGNPQAGQGQNFGADYSGSQAGYGAPQGGSVDDPWGDSNDNPPF